MPKAPLPRQQSLCATTILAFLLLLGLGLACRSTNQKQEHEQQQVAPRSGDDSALALTPPPRVLPFSHLAFLALPQPLPLGVQDSPSQVQVLTDLSSWQSFISQWSLERAGLSSPDFAREVVVVLSQTFSRTGIGLQVSQIRAGEHVTISFERKRPANACLDMTAESSTLVLHLVTVSRSQRSPNASWDPPSVQLELVAESQYCSLTTPALSKLRDKKALPFSLFWQQQQAQGPLDSNPRFIPISGLWGAWNLFMDQQCPLCEMPPLPTGYPNATFLLAIVDAAPAYERQGHSRLKIAGLHQWGDQVMVDLVREVELCPDSPLNQAFVVASIPQGALGPQRSPQQVTFHLPFPFVKESQVPCRGKPAG